MFAKPTPSAWSQLAVATLAYAVAVALTAFCIVPTILAPLPLSVLAPAAPPTQVLVARSALPETAP